MNRFIKIKRAIAVILCMAMFAALCGCEKTDGSSAASQSTKKHPVLHGSDWSDPSSSDSSQDTTEIVLTEEDRPLYKPTSLTVTLYDAQKSVYGFTFNTSNKPITPVIQIKKLGADTWSEYSLTCESAMSYDSKDSILSYYISKTQIALAANTTYIYRAWDKGAEIGTAEATLKTKNPKTNSFTFVHVSDSQDGSRDFGRVLSSVADKADFLLHTGDVVENSKHEPEWTAMLDGNFEYLSGIPMMAISGNHETTYKSGYNETYKHFNNNIPSQESTSLGYFYSFVYGDVKFIMLNTNDLTERQLKAEQYDWLVKELKNNTCKWTVVAMHNPLYSVGKYGASSDYNAVAVSLQQQLRGIFAQYGVDIVLQGHDHTISRTFPINGSGVAQTENFETVNGVDYSVNPSGVIYVMNGPAGSQTRWPYSVDDKLYKYAKNSQAASWAEFTFEGNMLTVTVKYHNGKYENVYYTWGIKKT